MNRRNFFQFLGAAGLAPFLPALPAQPAAATPALSVSKALWSGIYAKSGSAGAFAQTARGMGLSPIAIKGVGARSVGVRIATHGLQGGLARKQAVGPGPRARTAPELPTASPREVAAVDVAGDPEAERHSEHGAPAENPTPVSTEVSDAAQK